MNERTLKDEILAGTVGGLAGGAAMVAMMVVGKSTGMVQTPFPILVERRQERELGLAQDTGPKQEWGLGIAEHMLLSATFGAGYGAIDALFHPEPLPAGPLYALGLFGMNLLGVGPAFGWAREPWNVPPKLDAIRLMLHLLYGTVTATVTEKLLDAESNAGSNAGSNAA